MMQSRQGCRCSFQDFTPQQNTNTFDQRLASYKYHLHLYARNGCQSEWITLHPQKEHTSSARGLASYKYISERRISRYQPTYSPCRSSPRERM